MSKYKTVENFIELLGGLQIAASPLLAGVVIGTLVYLSHPDSTGLVIGAGIALIGLIAGVIWALRIWRSKGTIKFMSRVMASPELDNQPKTADPTLH